MTDQPSDRLHELLGQLEQARTRLDEINDPEEAVDVLNELNDLARDVQSELDRMRREGAGD